MFFPPCAQSAADTAPHGARAIRGRTREASSAVRTNRTTAPKITPIETSRGTARRRLNFLVSSPPEGVSRPGTAHRTVGTDITRIIPSGRFRRGRRAAAAPRPATPPPPRPVARGSASAGFFATASTRPASATSTTGSRRTTAAATRPGSGGGAKTRSKLYCDM